MDASADTRGEPRRRGYLPIVGVGASAGGLEAFSGLLRDLPLDTGMAFVLVQHLDPQHESALTQLLGRATSMPVREVTNNLRVEANHVYVIPPNTNLSIAQGVLQLQPRSETRAPQRSIDFFFESLAEDQRERAIGVILSGTASDGTLGLEAIKTEGGITFVQDESARYDSMPRSAIAAGCVDFVLPPEGIAKELARIARHSSVAGVAADAAFPEDDGAFATADEDDDMPLPSGGRGGPRTAAARARSEAATSKPGLDDFEKVLLLLRNHSGLDFSLYKPTTVQRRIARRMVLSKQDSLAGYVDVLRGNGKELDALYSDVLISVTSFFRNPDAFEALKDEVFPRLLTRRSDDPLRVWVFGCSTGQEAYSIAMTFAECAEIAPRMRKLQVFATDLNETLLDKARHGLYNKSIANEVSPERLRRFFVEEQGGYRVCKTLREMVVFARQSLIADPPFSRIDLISCRNLLIYLEPSLQKKALLTFHYALKPGGFLFLGASESIAGFTELFAPLDRKHRIYARRAAPTPAFHLLPRKERSDPGPRIRPLQTGRAPPREQSETAGGFRAELSAQREADRITVNQFAPPGVLVNAELQVLQFRGATGAYLEPPAGRANFDVLKMAREGLMLALRTAIDRASKANRTARKENVRVRQNGGTRMVNVEVIPLKNLRERCFLILFEDAGKSARATARAPGGKHKTALAEVRAEPARVAALEGELAETRDYLQSIQDQHESTNEDLQAANEEVQSANEELQSINEELETSKEELESANEELVTLNEELANRNAELNRLNSDLTNLQASTRLAILLLGRDLTIRRFSPQAESQFDLLVTDLGRPVAHLGHRLVFPTTDGGEDPADLESLVADVVSSMHEREREVRDQQGRWYLLRVRPYLNADDKIDGAVLVLVDIDALKRSAQAIAAARDYAENTIATVTVTEPLLVLDPELRVESANPAFYRAFGVEPAETIGRSLFDLGNRQWDIPALRSLLQELLPRDGSVENFEVERDFPQLGRRNMLLNARRINNPNHVMERILLAIEDVTDRRREDSARTLRLQCADERLRHSELRFSRFMQQLPGLAWIKDLNGRYVYVNDAAEKAFGVRMTNLVGKTDEEVFPPETAAQFREHDRRALASETGIQTIEILPHPDGTIHHSIVSKFSIPGHEDTAAMLGGVAIDITERKRYEDALSQADQRKNEFLALLAHELRNPLAPIRNSLEVMRRTLRLGPTPSDQQSR
jgi:two-component system CheB/CheR fusion protein